MARSTALRSGGVRRGGLCTRRLGFGAALLLAFALGLLVGAREPRLSAALLALPATESDLGVPPAFAWEAAARVPDEPPSPLQPESAGAEACHESPVDPFAALGEPEVEAEGRRGAASTAPRARAPAPPPARVGGLVLSRDGEPLGGARVRLLVGARRRHEVRTAPDGRFDFERLPPGRYTLHAHAAGYLPAAFAAPIDLAPGAARTGLILRLEPAAVIEGRVRDRDGRPVRGAKVWVRRGGAFGVIATRTDAEGRYVLRAGAPGANRVSARHADYLPARPRTVRLRPGQERVTRVDFVLRRGGAIELRVYDETGRLLSIPLRLYDRRGRLVARGRSREGRGRFSGLRDGRYVVFGGDDAGRVGRVTVTVRGRRRVRAELVLEAGARMDGVVLGPDGEPAPGVLVRADRQGASWRREARTDREGRFVLEGLVPGRYVVRLIPRGPLAPPPPLQLPVLARDEIGGLEFVLSPGAVLEGEVIAVDGGPAGGAWVGIYDARSRFLRAARTRADGRFVLEGLPRGALQLFARLGAELAREQVAVLEAHPPPLRVFCYPMGVVQGRVLTPSGEPVAGARCGAESLDRIVRRGGRADRGGRFALRQLYAGSYRVWATAGGRRAEAVVVIAPGQRLEAFDLVIPGP